MSSEQRHQPASRKRRLQISTPARATKCRPAFQGIARRAAHKRMQPEGGETGSCTGNGRTPHAASAVKSKLVSIIVVAHDALDLTRRCLDAVASAGLSCNYELVLVDNGCRDSIKSLVGEFSPQIRNIRYVRNEENLSYSAANNAGAAVAEGHRLLFLNNDVFIAPGAVEQLLLAMDSHPRAGVVGGKLLYPGTHAIQHAGINQMLWGYISNYGVAADAEDARFNRTGEIFAVTGAMLCVSRPLFDMVGGLSSCYQYGYEDADLCLKIRDIGWEVLYVPGACGFHCESATLKDQTVPGNLDWNYSHYRIRWNDVLVPAEQRYAESLLQMGVRKVAVFGVGRAAAGLFGALQGYGIQTVAFSTTTAMSEKEEYLGLPVVPLEKLSGIDFDRLIAGSQYFFQVENLLSAHDPKREAIFPAISMNAKAI